MELGKARRLAAGLMREHDLTVSAGSSERGRWEWSFGFDRSRRRFGVCIPQRKRIQLSEHLTLLNDETTIKATVLHEIAHALTFLTYGSRVGHDHRWKQIAASIGADPARCYDSMTVQTPALPWIAVCPNGHRHERSRRWHRRRSVSCAKCSRRFDERFLLRLLPNPDYGR